MQHVVGNARKTVEAAGPVEIGKDWRGPQGAERAPLLRATNHRTNPEAAYQPRNDPAGYVTAPYNQHPFHFSTFH